LSRQLNLSSQKSEEARDLVDSPGRCKPIKVLHLVESTLAGVRRHVIDLLSGLNQDYPDQVELHLGYSLRRADGNFKENQKILESLGVKCFECDMTRSVNPLVDTRAVIQIVDYIKRYEIDIVHTHSAKAGYVGRLAAKFSSQTKSIYTPHASPFRLSTKYHILEALAGWLLSDAIIAVSGAEREELISNKICSGQKTYTINSGIPSTVFTRSSATINLGHPTRKFVVGTVGRLSLQKAPKRFIEIAERTLEKFPDVEFRWIGDGELRPEIEQMIQSKRLTEKVKIIGWLDNVEKALLEFDVFLLNSDYEALSYTPMEAMRAGLPCVLSDVTGSSDLVKKGETGFIVFPADIDGYVTSIIQLLSDQNLREKMGQAGHIRWQEKFHLSSMVFSTAHLYQDLLPTYFDEDKVTV
jgi:glycosyltransferase involved in cell wall biosynthesis